MDPVVAHIKIHIAVLFGRACLVGGFVVTVNRWTCNLYFDRNHKLEDVGCDRTCHRDCHWSKDPDEIVSVNPSVTVYVVKMKIVLNYETKQSHHSYPQHLFCHLVLLELQFVDEI